MQKTSRCVILKVIGYVYSGHATIILSMKFLTGSEEQRNILREFR